MPHTSDVVRRTTAHLMRQRDRFESAPQPARRRPRTVITLPTQPR